MYTLYTLAQCPFCNKVKEFLHENNIDFKEKEITLEENEKELIELGGKRQVPFLINHTNDKKLYESSDIIEYIASLL